MVLLSHFSHVRLCVTPEMAAHQAPLSVGFSRQEHWSGLPFPSPKWYIRTYFQGTDRDTHVEKRHVDAGGMGIIG